MHSLINASINHSRAVMMVLLLILFTGISAYNSIPREMDPDVQIPFIYVSMHHEGISPEDAERLLIRPMEKELRTIEGVKEMTASASLSHASVMLEFQAGFDADTALQDVRDKVDLAKAELPADTDEPTVNEINLSRFPVVNVILTGNVPEYAFTRLARELRDRIEEIPQVLSVTIAGTREESVEIILDPLKLESYGLTADLIAQVVANNQLIAAGSINTKGGSFQIKVPGLVETLEDIIHLPIKTNGDAVVTLGDVAEVRKTFKDVENFARVNGENALVLEVSKRTGENIIDTIDKVRRVMDEAQKHGMWPEGVHVYYAQDRSGTIRDILRDLQNNIILAIVLVVLVIWAVMGTRPSLLVAVSIPGSFLIGILVIAALDLTLNIVVLFSLILSIGMLVDAAIVTVEYANRRIIDGVPHKEAYREAAQRMCWPIVSSTLTTLLVFMPLLFWPGIIGQFMKYLPLTLIATLTGSLFMALIFVPTLGSIIGKLKKPDERTLRMIHLTESGDMQQLEGFTGRYVRLLEHILKRPLLFCTAIIGSLVVVIMAFGALGAGTEFFPDVEPDNAQVIIRARGNLSTQEKDAIVKEVETKILNMNSEVRVFYARAGTISNQNGSSFPEDTVGIIMLEFANWRDRRKANAILQEMRDRTADMPGLILEMQKEQGGPTAAKPIQIQLSSTNPVELEKAVEKLREGLGKIEGITDITDTRSVPGMEWTLDVNREQAARFGVNIATLGKFVQLVSNGLVVTTYRPDDTDDEVDILLRFPEEERSLSQLEALRVITPQGAVPIMNFVTLQPAPKIGQISRTEGRRSLMVEAGVAEGVNANAKVAEIMEWLKTQHPDPSIFLKFKGDQEQQAETGQFLGNAFMLSLFAMALLLTWQFNRFWHTFIIMSAVFLSTAGVLLGLLVTAQPFGIVMCGIGIIALGGIVVNNNIIFIDTYAILRQEGKEVHEAILRTGAQRLRPILLTAGTTVLGLIPMVLQMNIDFLAPEITFGAPSTQWWTQLSTAIAGGLSFATILTLFFTPCLLLLGARGADKFRWKRK